ncbi:hypothetical protein [Salinimicrobium sp. WS361]|uniref:hypothetical protein n=1 Tax=Salinimicrobium sp. WS361 TaxID=3425123 RepID=UPI003D6FA1DA
MKKIFLLLILLACSCGSSKPEWPRKAKLVMTVSEISGDSATLTSINSSVKYFVSSDGRNLHEQKMFFMYVQPAELPGEFYGKVYQAFSLADTIGIRRQMKMESYLKLNPKL